MTENDKKFVESIVNSTLIANICKVVNILRSNAFTPKTINLTSPYLRRVSKRLDLTKHESLIFCMFMDMCDDTCIHIRDIARHFDINIIDTINLLGDADALFEKGLVIKKTKHDSTNEFMVPPEVIEAIRNDVPYKRNIKKNLKIEELFQEIDDVYSGFEDSPEELEANLNLLIENNQHLDFCHQMKHNPWKLTNNDLLLLLFFCHKQVNFDDDRISENDWKDYFIRSVSKRFSNELGNDSSRLIRENLVQPKIEGGIDERRNYCLTTEIKKSLLGELSGLFAKRAVNTGNLKRHSTIIRKKLFYNDAETNDIAQLTSLIDEKNFCDVQHRLEEKGLRKGFCCLFHGSPGTGKTETVYQLARNTKRDLFVIDVSNIKSCWVGESEKNISKAFEDYKLCVEHCRETNTPAPILLFNEADAVLGIRQEGAQRAVDKMENSIQNIILQEMEDLDGIMIATTNLTQNLDRAFERRFLFRIKFEKPSQKVKESIWKSIIPSLTKQQAKLLAAKYDFSGGQIENIARKCTIDYVLSGKKTSLAEIERFCQGEQTTGISRRIGF